jgi:putative Holliday junction resolvase
MLGRVLAIDYGRRRIGVARSDALGIAAHPMPTLVGEPEQNLEKLVALCREDDITRIVMGLPLHMDGGDSAMAQEVRAFATKLAERTALPLEYVDERLTSWSAEQEIRDLPKKKHRRDKARVDAMAALAILRDWMNSRA